MSSLPLPDRAKRNPTDFYSYLNVRYGLVWTDLKGLQVPLRVGDVVILPGKFRTNAMVRGTHSQSLDFHLEWATLVPNQNLVYLSFSSGGARTDD